MPESTGSDRWRDLIGVSGPRIKWSSALAFCLALLASNVLGSYLRAYVYLARASEEISAPTQGPPLVYTVYYLLFPLLGALCAVVVFRLVRNLIVAAIVSAVVYAVGSLPRNLHVMLALIAGHIPESSEIISILYISFLGFCLFLLGMTMALRWVKRVWVALPAGAAAGSLLMLGFTPLQSLIYPASRSIEDVWRLFRWQLPYAPYDFVRAALFAGVFWMGLEMARAEKGRLSKRFYLASGPGGVLLSLFLGIMGFGFALERARSATFVLTVGVAFVVTAYVVVVMAVLVYRMWVAIQDGSARTTPGKAVGLMFIPFFNFYWGFQVLWGFAKDYNRYVERHSVQVGKLPPGLFLAYFILCFAAAVPLVGPFVVAANAVVGSVMVSKICDAVNALPAAPPSVLVGAA